MPNFHEIIQQYRIKVPLIQRDYAQGRDAYKDVRNDFLGALHDALLRLADEQGEQRRPLNLDFVYGSIEAGDVPRFLPLDGQQRLTTLFLLHWYLAWRDNRLPHFQAMVGAEQGSRFTYRVRPSSTEFFDALVQFVPESSPDDLPREDPEDREDIPRQGILGVRYLLEDQPWFFLHWRSDPTIQAVLTMLDAIHGRFRDTHDLYAQLVDEAPPAITFHLLTLDHFGLTDDLYIKMNARGKPLTAFETFKARFEELLKLFPGYRREPDGAQLPVAEFFERRIDGQWTDFFWHYQHPTFDEAAMNLVWALIRVSLDPASARFAADTTALGEKTLGAGFTLFHDRQWLTPRFADHLINLLEAWSADRGELRSQLPNPDYFNEAAFFQRAISTPWALTYLELVQFAAFVFYLTQYRGAVQQDRFQEWMRVVTNLASNSDIERPEEFKRSLMGLQTLVPDGQAILPRLAGWENEPLGFSPQQVREEALKATLILKGDDWRACIDDAERHGYFRRQIEFLLKFSGVLDRWLSDRAVPWGDADDAEYRRKFLDYFSKATAVFAPDGLMNFGACRWERALLMKGDYLLSAGINWCFLVNREGDANWRRLLRGSFRPDPDAEGKREYVRELLDDIDVGNGVANSLDEVLLGPLPAESWRRAMIDQPELIEYCRRRMVRWGNENIYLLRGIKMSGEYAELFTYHLKVGLLTNMHNNGELNPFGAPRYLFVNGEAQTPHVYLEWRRDDATSIRLSIFHSQGAYLLKVTRNQGGGLPIDLQGELGGAGFGINADATEAVSPRVERADIRSNVEAIVAIAGQL